MIVVTGGTGFVGSHLLYLLTLENEKIRALKRKSSGTDFTKKVFGFYTDNVDKFFSRIEWVDADMLDYMALEDAMDGVGLVYHAASSVSFNPSDANAMIKNNIDGTSNLVTACLKRGVGRLCHVSSVAALGRDYDGRLTDEENIWKYSPRKSAYSVSKFFSEMEVWRGINEGLDAVIVNPSVILGPGNWRKGSPSFFYRVYKGMKYYTEGVTGFVDVRDVCRCMTELVKKPLSGERFILNSENISYKMLFEMIAENLGKRPPSVHASVMLTEIGWRLEWIRSKLFFSSPAFTREMARAGRSRTYYSNQKTKEALSFQFTPVKETVEWTASLFLKELEQKVK